MYKISVIIPTYNADKTLSMTLNSLLNQNESFEVIVIDGKSRDNTLKILEEYTEKFKEKKIDYIYISEKDSGIYDAMNKGIKKAKGKWLYFLGADDLVVHGAFEKIGLKLKKEETIYYGDAYFFKQHRIHLGKFSKFKITRANICHQAIFYPKIIFSKVGYYNLNYKLWADYDFNIRCYVEKIEFSYTKILVALYNDETGASSDNEDLDFLKVIDKKIYKIGKLSYFYFKLFKNLSRVKQAIIRKKL